MRRMDDADTALSERNKKKKKENDPKASKRDKKKDKKSERRREKSNRPKPAAGSQTAPGAPGAQAAQGAQGAQGTEVKPPQEVSDDRPQSDSESDSSDVSEEIVVYETPENQSYERKVTIGLLSRVGFHEQFWRNKISSYFVILSFLLTIDNVVFFYQYAQAFGLWWTSTFALCMILVGFPLAYLEMALGQYTSTGVYLVFDRMCSGFVGVGVAALLFNFLLSCSDHALFVDMVKVMVESTYILSSEYPWHNCLSENDMSECHTWSRSCNLVGDIVDAPSVPDDLAYGRGLEFKYISRGDSCVRPGVRGIAYGLLGLSMSAMMMRTASVNSFVNSEIQNFETWERYSYPTHTHILYVFVGSLLCIYIVTRNPKITVVLLTITCLLTFCGISFLLHGLLFLFVPESPHTMITKFPFAAATNTLDAWYAAFVLTFRCLKLGQGAWTFFGSQNGFRNNLAFDCMFITIVVVFVTYFYGLFHAIAVDSYESEIRDFFAIPAQTNEELLVNEDLMQYNVLTLTTRILSSSYIFGDFEAVVTCFYSSIVAFTSLANKVIRLQILLSAIVEVNPSFSNPNARFTLAVILTLINMLLQLGLPFRTGYRRLAMFNAVVYPIVGSSICLCELLVVGVFYGFRLFFSNTAVMLYGAAKSESKKFNMFLHSITLADWSVILPISCLFIIWATVHLDSLLENYSRLDTYNVLIIILILLPIPVMLLYSIHWMHSMGNNIAPLFKRNPDLWGPRSRSNRLEAERAERVIRKWW